MISNLIARLKQSKFLKNIFIIASGSALSQVITFLFSPIIVRIYSPEQMGFFRLYTSIIAVITVAGSLRYEWAIPICEDEKKATNAFILCFKILLIFTVILLLILIFIPNLFLSMFNAQELGLYRFFIPVGFVIAGSSSVLSQWGFRKKNFKTLTSAKFAKAGSGGASKILIGLVNSTYLGLFLGDIISRVARFLTLKIGIKGINIKEYNDKNQQVLLLKEHKKFPLLSIPSQLLSSLGVQMPVFFLSGMYSSDIVGYYSLTMSVLTVPLQLIGTSIGDVFYAEAARYSKSDPEKVKKAADKLLLLLIALGIGICIILLVLGPFLFTFVYGDTWAMSGTFSQILSIYLFCRLVFLPISRFYSIFGRQKAALILDIIRVASLSIVFILAKELALSVYLTLGLFAIDMSIVYFATFLYGRVILKQEINKKHKESLED